MALELNVSKINNTVTFNVDKVSMKAAKDSIKEIEKFAANIEPAFKVDKAKKQIEEIRKEYERLQKEVNKPLSTTTRPPSPTSNTPAPRPSGGSTQPGGSLGDAEERRRQARIDTANVARSRFQFQSGRFRNVGQEDIDSAALRANEVTRAFEAGEVSARRMNSVLTQELTKLRDIGKENTAQANANYKMARWRMAELVREGRERERQNKREEVALERQRRIVERTAERRKERLTDAALSLNPGMLAGGLGIAAAVEGISRIAETLQSTAERITLVTSGAKNVQTNPNAILSLVAYGQANGIDSASVKKLTDNLKDIRERIASSVQSATLNKKGQWTGGDAGVDLAMNTFGWNPGQIKKYESDPLNFASAIVNEGQRRGLPDAQIGHMLENLADDFMYYEPALKNGGAELLKFTQTLVDTGSNMTDEMGQAGQSFQQLSLNLSRVREGMDNHFLLGFMDNLDTSSTSIKNFASTMDHAAEQAGGVIAKLVNDIVNLGVGFGNLVEWINEHFPHKTDPQLTRTSPTNAFSSQPSYDPGRSFSDYLNYGKTSGWGPLTDLMDMIKNTSWTDNTRGNLFMGLQPSDNQYSFLSSSFNDPRNIGYQSGYSQLPINANVVIPDSAIQVSVTPDSTGFSNLVSAQVGVGLTNQFNQLTLDTLSSTATRN